MAKKKTNFQKKPTRKKAPSRKSRKVKKKKSFFSSFNFLLILVILLLVVYIIFTNQSLISSLRDSFSYFSKAKTDSSLVDKTGKPKITEKKAKPLIKKKEEQKSFKIPEEKEELKPKIAKETENKPQLDENLNHLENENNIYDKMDSFRKNITVFAKKYLGIKVENGSDPLKTNKTDNSHLIYAIYSSSAKQSGLKFKNYLTVEQLIKKSRSINLSQLENGDLIVLKNKMVGMIYNSEQQDGFKLIYASSKAGKVISVESKDLRKYWLKKENKKGYYRPKEGLFE